jgi:hypothetical protein
MWMKLTVFATLEGGKFVEWGLPVETIIINSNDILCINDSELKGTKILFRQEIGTLGNGVNCVIVDETFEQIWSMLNATAEK